VNWVVIGAWIGAAVVAALVLGFCAYEVTWKANRLRRDTLRLQSVSDQLTELRSELAAAQQRAAAARQR
jgi:outer membrane murein-binding lipoprotein Lpp